MSSQRVSKETKTCQRSVGWSVRNFMQCLTLACHGRVDLNQIFKAQDIWHATKQPNTPFLETFFWANTRVRNRSLGFRNRFFSSSASNMNDQVVMYSFIIKEFDNAKFEIHLVQPSAIDYMSRFINSVAVRHESFGVSHESAHLSGIWTTRRLTWDCFCGERLTPDLHPWSSPSSKATMSKRAWRKQRELSFCVIHYKELQS